MFSRVVRKFQRINSVVFRGIRISKENSFSYVSRYKNFRKGVRITLEKKEEKMVGLHIIDLSSLCLKKGNKLLCIVFDPRKHI